VKAVLMLGAKRQDGTPYYPQTHFYKLPKDVLFIILQYAVSKSVTPETGQSKNHIKFKRVKQRRGNKKQNFQDDETGYWIFVGVTAISAITGLYYYMNKNRSM
jgi:hypothetical protein